MNEKWKSITNYEDLYQVSNFGNIKNLKKNKLLKGSPDKNGYLRVHLSKYGKSQVLLIHKIVFLEFIDKNDRKNKHINHIDNNITNNSENNLELVSCRENMCHRSKFLKKTSNYTGVCWNIKLKKWISQIYYSKKVIHLGVFQNEIDAYNAYKNFEKENNINNKYS